MATNRSSSTASAQISIPGTVPEWLTNAYDRSMPIFQRRREIVETLRGNQVVVIAGETGCGKTTQVPLLCREARGEDAGRIVVAQPRRIAAVSCAAYLASLLPPDRKTLVGHKIRFHENIRPENGILFATDGIILAQTAGDRMLNKYGTIIIDEAHERSLPIDFLLGYLRSLLPRRPDLKVVIASATMDTRLFSRSFGNAPVITVSGRRYPVEIRYEPVISLWRGSALRSYVDGVIHAVRSIIDAHEEGDILAFLPTVDDIHECATGLRALFKGAACDVLPLFGRMSPAEQAAIFSRSSRRRIICATNIAETSLTVPGIRFVVDAGLARCVRFDPAAGITRMPVERISKAAADQRAGRCGRMQNGICIRLYSESDYASMPRFTQPEMRRANLAGVILRMAHLGFGKPQQFPFIQQPSPAMLDAGFRQLRFLGALDARGGLTNLGKAMAVLPLDPAIARMLLHARENGVFGELAVIASALSVGEMSDQANPGIKRPRGRPDAGNKTTKGFVSDFADLVGVWRSLPWTVNGGVSRRRLESFCENNGFVYQRIKEWINVHRQLIRNCKRFGQVKSGFAGSYEQVHKSLLSALAGSIAEAAQDGSYTTGRMREIMISPGSRLFKTRHDWVLLHDITDAKRPYARYAAVIKAHWVLDLFPRQCRVAYEEPRYDPDRATVVCLRQVTFNGLPIVKNQPMEYGRVHPREAHDVFVKEALVDGAVGRDYDFLAKNRAVVDLVESMQQKMRTRSLYRGERALADFYGDRLPGVFSASQLDERIGGAKGDRFLEIRPGDILSGEPPGDLNDYPDAITVAGMRVPVSYVYKPGSDDDGATAVIPLGLYRAVPVYFWEWLLPVFMRPRIEALALEAFEKNAPVDFDLKVDEATEALEPGRGHFMNQAIAAAQRIFAFPGSAALSVESRSPHLWLRLRIVDEKGNELDAFRPPLRFAALPVASPGLRPHVWQPWCAPWEMEDIFEWKAPRAFEKVRIQPAGQLAAVFGITALSLENGRIGMRVFFSEGAACRGHRQAIRFLLERELEDALAWAWRDFLKNSRIPFQVRELMESLEAQECLERVFNEIVSDIGYELPADPEAFVRLKEQALRRMQRAGPDALALVSAVLPEYAACRDFLLERMKSGRNTAAQTEHLAPCQRLLEEYFETLVQPEGLLEKIKLLPRYLKGMSHRMRMAIDKPLRYGQCARIIGEYHAEIRRLRKRDTADLPDIARLLDQCEDAIEEYALSIFSHGQIAPRFPASEPRVRKCMEELKKAVSGKDQGIEIRDWKKSNTSITRKI